MEESVEEGFHLHGAGNWKEKVEALWRNYEDEDDDFLPKMLNLHFDFDFLTLCNISLPPGRWT